MITVRPFDNKYAAELTAMMVEMTQFYGASISPALDKDAQITEQAQNMDVLLAFDGDKLAGFTTFKTLFPVSGLLAFTHVQQIYVGLASRRLDVARQLMIGIAKTAQDRCCQWIEWATSSSNTDAQAFYESLEVSKSQKVHYVLKGDALKRLASA